MTVVQSTGTDRQNIIAAIIAGVSSYMEEEQRSKVARIEKPIPAATLNLWAISGREEMMRMRVLWQRRIV
ncbi:MAG: hypothetical protein JSW38_07415 [Dehalococcoidia bacterium]|nr:MAG: hypothetical protein JSW38_07415 [Dehalococcoidia bacterium]